MDKDMQNALKITAIFVDERDKIYPEQNDDLARKRERDAFFRGAVLGFKYGVNYKLDEVLENGNIRS